MLALIGSRALALRAPGLLKRNPLDFDFIATQEAYEDFVKKNNDKIRPEEIYPLNDGQKWIVKGEKIEGQPQTILEFEIAEKRESAAEFLKVVAADERTISNSFGMVPRLDLLFMLKKSHRYLKNSPHFAKNFNDYHAMKRVPGVSADAYADLLKLREKETYAEQKHPKLNVKKEAFFSNDQVEYVYDHDSIHISVCDRELGKPAYLFYAEPGEEVKSSKKLFFEASDHVKLRGVVEESAVLAIERSLVPYPDKKTPREAWMFAYSKVATSITSGWFREWAYENGPQVLKAFPADFFDRFKEGLASGIVKPFNPNVAVNPYK